MYGERVPVIAGEVNIISNEHAAFLALMQNCQGKNLIVTIKSPMILKRRYSVSNVVWLTYFPQGYERAYTPDRLEFEVLYEISEFFKNGGSCLLIHGVEYLSNVLSEESVFRFVSEIRKMKGDATVIIAVNHNTDRWRALGKSTYNKKLKIEKPMVLMRDPPHGKDVFMISPNVMGAGIRVESAGDAERLILSGTHEIEKIEGDVFIDSLGFIMRVVETKRVFLFLKDVIDLATHRGHMVYISFSPTVLEGEISSLIEETGTEAEVETFVGREREMSELIVMLEETLLPKERVVLISGEAGMGKTTLVRHLIAHAVTRGFLILQGRSYYSSEEPYLPIKEAFEPYIGPLISESPRGEIKDGRSVESMRKSMFYDLTQRVRELAKKRPLLIFFDDVHWIDDSSLALLHYMAEHLRDERIMVVCTYRPEDAEESLKMALRRMSRDKLTEEIRLGPLGTEHIMEISRDFLGSKMDRALAENLRKRTGGNPLFTVEMLRHIHDMGGSIEDLKGELDIPRIIKDLTEERLGKLTTEERKMVEIASLIGDDVDIEILAEMLGVEPFTVVEMGESVIKVGIWAENEHGGFSFKHTVIREVIEREIMPLKRRYMHLNIASKMEDMRGDEPKRYASIAYHYKKGENYGKAYEFYMKAGKYAESIFAHENALKEYLEALKLMETMDVLEKIGYIYSLSGEYEKSREYYWRALQKVEDREKKKKLYRLIAHTFETQGDFKKAMKYIEAGLSVDSGDTPETSKLIGMKGWIMTKEGNTREAMEILMQEREMAERINYKEGVANAYGHLGILHYRMGNYEDAIDFLKKSIEIARELDDIPLECSMLNNLGVVYEEMGNIAIATEYYEESAKIAEKWGDKYTLGALLNNLSVAYQDMGDLDSAMKYLVRAREISEMMGDKFGLALVLENMGQIYKDLEKYDLAMEYLLSALQIGRDIESDTIIVEELVSIAEVHFLMGEHEKALKEAEEALEVAKRIHSKPMIRSAYRVMSKVYRERGDYSTAKNYLLLSMPPETEGELAEQGFAKYEMGILLRRMGEEEEGNKYLKDALEIFEKLGFALWAKRVRGELSER